MRILFSTLALLFCCGFATAQGCQSAPSVVSDLNRQIGKELVKLGCGVYNPNNFSECVQTADKYRRLVAAMTTYWNRRSNSWATIGPRRLDFGQFESGRIVSTGGRMYISCVPSNKNSMTVEIQEIDGKGKTSYAICKVDSKGNYRNLKTGWFNENSKGKSNKKQKRTHTITGVKGHLITIHFDGKSVGNTFQYKIKVK